VAAVRKKTEYDEGQESAGLDRSCDELSAAAPANAAPLQAASGKLVAPSNDNSCVISKSPAREIVLAAATRDGRTEFGQR
jgi:hypothetical protein